MKKCLAQKNLLVNSLNSFINSLNKYWASTTADTWETPGIKTQMTASVDRTLLPGVLHDSHGRPQRGLHLPPHLASGSSHSTRATFLRQVVPCHPPCPAHSMASKSSACGPFTMWISLVKWGKRSLLSRLAVSIKRAWGRKGTYTLVSTHRAPGGAGCHTELSHSESQGTLSPGTTSRHSFPGSLQWCSNLTETATEPSWRRSPFLQQTQLMPPHLSTQGHLLLSDQAWPLQSFTILTARSSAYWPFIHLPEQLKPCPSHEDSPGAQQLPLPKYSLMAQHEPGASSSRS